jgi:DNA-directed RNA polymerase specialized sigma24 family protein
VSQTSVAEIASGSQGSENHSDLKNLSDLELVRLIGENPRNNHAFLEFIARFEELIQLYIFRTCQELNYKAGLSKIEDLTQDVYEQLLDNHCFKLKQITKNVRGFLIEMTSNTVRNDRRKFFTLKRRPPGGIAPLDPELPQWTIPERRKPNLIETLAGPDDSTVRELMDEIKFCLDHILQHTRKKERDRLIMMCYLFQDLDPAEIAALHRFDLTVKRLENLISAIMQALRQCLQRKGFGKHSSP